MVYHFLSTRTPTSYSSKYSKTAGQQMTCLQMPRADAPGAMEAMEFCDALILPLISYLGLPRHPVLMLLCRVSALCRVLFSLRCHSFFTPALPAEELQTLKCRYKLGRPYHVD
jgi:hypothetical protein